MQKNARVENTGLENAGKKFIIAVEMWDRSSSSRKSRTSPKFVVITMDYDTRIAPLIIQRLRTKNTEVKAQQQPHIDTVDIRVAVCENDTQER